MSILKYKLIPQSKDEKIGITIPLNIAFVNLADIASVSYTHLFYKAIC